MSSPSPRRPSLEATERAACMCVTGQRCTSYGRGHALHLIQLRLAAATPSLWIDALVERVGEDDREIVVRTVEENASIALWHAAGLAVVPGEPVALHERYGVLSVGGVSRNVAVLG